MKLLLDPTEEQLHILGESADLLVVGPPGTGKTSVALAKATDFIVGKDLPDHQSVLFLSFSNAAVHRIREAATGRIVPGVMKRLHITTFHGFCYSVLSGHWRLAGLRRPFRLLPPEDETNLESRLEADALATELDRMEKEEGKVRFDRFPLLVADLFERHQAIREAYSQAHPLVIVDEYQDTSDDQEVLVSLLSKPGQVIYLGDPDQRIYDFVEGTRADRLERTANREGVVRVVLDTNHRSGRTDISAVGDAILAGRRKIPKPSDVHVLGFGNRASQVTVLKRTIVRLEKYLKNNLPTGTRSSVAIMARTNDYIAGLSKALLETDETWEYPFRHQVLLNLDAVAIAWDSVMIMLEPQASPAAQTAELLRAAARLNRLKAKSTTRINQAERLERWANDLAAGKLGRQAQGANKLLSRVQTLTAPTGDPVTDCSARIDLFRGLPGDPLDQLVKVLDLRSPVGGVGDMSGPLGALWSERQDYKGARALADATLLQERMELGSQGQAQRILMTIHKCKGKQFDGVIIVDGHQGRTRLASGGALEARRLLRVGITRASMKAVILTPTYDPCPLLPAFQVQ